MRPNDQSQKRDARTDGGGELGKILADARAARGVTIEEIATELRIEPHLLHALEACRFEELGPPVFAKGYLKQYGNRLGLKYPDLLAEYYRLVEPKEVTLSPSRTIKLRDERQITVWIIAALALALLAVFLMVWYLGEPPGGRAPQEESEDGEAAARIEDAALARPAGAQTEAPSRDAEAPAVSPRDGGSGAGESDALEAAVGAESGSTDPVTGSGGVAAPLSDPIPSDTTDEPATAADSATNDRERVPAGPTTTIEFAFLEDCWLEVADARGARLFYGLGQAGALRRMTGVPPIDVFLGNANGVSVTVDGVPYVVPARDRQGNLARFVVDGPTD